MCEMFSGLFTAEVFEWIRPEQVTHRTKRRRLLESIQLHTDRHAHRSTDRQEHVPVTDDDQWLSTIMLARMVATLESSHVYMCAWH